MPLFRFRLEATDGSGHYRTGSGSFESADEASAYLLRREDEAVFYRLDTDELAALETAEAAAHAAGGKPDGATRAKLAAHRQTAPYELVTLEEVE